jgi:hypothetical protein
MIEQAHGRSSALYQFEPARSLPDIRVLGRSVNAIIFDAANMSPDQYLLHAPDDECFIISSYAPGVGDFKYFSVHDEVYKDADKPLNFFKRGKYLILCASGLDRHECRGITEWEDLAIESAELEGTFWAPSSLIAAQLSFKKHCLKA